VAELAEVKDLGISKWLFRGVSHGSIQAEFTPENKVKIDFRPTLPSSLELFSEVAQKVARR
jgi:hypothetical protein